MLRFYLVSEKRFPSLLLIIVALVSIFERFGQELFLLVPE